MNNRAINEMYSIQRGLKSSLTLIFVLFFFASYAQPTLDWVNTLGGTNYDYGNAVEIDNNGNVYFTGYFRGTADFDPGPNVFNLTTSGDMDAYLCKLDPQGNFLWAFKFGGATASSPNNDNGNDLVIDQLGNVLLTGAFTGSTDFDPSPNNFIINSVGSNDIYIAKYNANGGFLWAKSIGSSSSEQSTSIDVFGVNNVYLTGNFSGTLDFDPGPNTYNLTTPNTCASIYHLKLDQNGNFLWANQTGTYAANVGFSTLDNLENLISTGRFYNTVDFDPGSGVFNLSASGTGSNSFVRKMDTQGNLLWVKKISGTFSEGTSIVCDNNNDIYVSGVCNGIVDFDIGTGTSIYTTSNDGFVAKFNANGDFQWVKLIGNTFDYEPFCSIETDAFNNVYALGFSNGNLSNLDIDPSSNVQFLTGASGTFLLQLNSNGDFISACSPQLGNVLFCETNSGSFNSGGFCIKSHQSGIFITGALHATVDFDPSPQTYSLSAIGNANPTDIFIQKLNTCSSSSNTITTSSCLSYAAPDGQVFTQSGQYTSTLTNAAGCDSVITINLTIHQPSSSTLTTSSCLSYAAPDGQVFTQSGQYTSTLTNAAGCDSVLTINLAIHQPSASSITESACKEYTAPDGQVYTQSGTYTSVIPNANGCDSTITIALTINSIVAGIAQNGIELSSTTNNAQYQWIRCENNQAIAGATGQLYSASANGQYAVVVTQNNCSDTSDCVTVSTVGMDEFNLENVILFPNPTHGFVQLSIDASLIDQLIVTNLLGEIMHTSENVNALNVSQLAPGMYEMIVFINGRKNFLRFVKAD